MRVRESERERGVDSSQLLHVTTVLLTSVRTDRAEVASSIKDSVESIVQELEREGEREKMEEGEGREGGRERGRDRGQGVREKGGVKGERGTRGGKYTSTK